MAKSAHNAAHRNEDVMPETPTKTKRKYSEMSRVAGELGRQRYRRRQLMDRRESLVRTLDEQIGALDKDIAEAEKKLSAFLAPAPAGVTVDGSGGAA